jgi:hypothetical protein
MALTRKRRLSQADTAASSSCSPHRIQFLDSLRGAKRLKRDRDGFDVKQNHEDVTPMDDSPFSPRKKAFRATPTRSIGEEAYAQKTQTNTHAHQTKPHSTNHHSAADDFILRHKTPSRKRKERKASDHGLEERVTSLLRVLRSIPKPHVRLEAVSLVQQIVETEKRNIVAACKAEAGGGTSGGSSSSSNSSGGGGGGSIDDGVGSDNNFAPKEKKLKRYSLQQVRQVVADALEEREAVLRTEYDETLNRLLRGESYLLALCLGEWVKKGTD